MHAFSHAGGQAVRPLPNADWASLWGFRSAECDDVEVCVVQAGLRCATADAAEAVSPSMPSCHKLRLFDVVIVLKSVPGV